VKIQKNGQAIIVDCPAKINLFLESHGTRPDGYHELETVMQAITLYDRLVLEPADGIELSCNDPSLPAGAGNLAHKAATLMLKEIGGRGVRIHLEKNIPAQSGMGGGSSDAAGVIAGMNALCGMGLDVDRMAKMGAAIGSDVPFFLYGGTALCRGRGELVERINVYFTISYVVCCPNVGLSTAEVYKKLDKIGLTTAQHGATFLVESLKTHNFAGLNHSVFNRLGQVAAALSVEVSTVMATMREASGLNATVTGSGSAVFVAVDSFSRAGEIAAELGKRNLGRVFVAQSERPS